MIRKLRAKFIVINMALVTLMLVLMLGTVIRLTSDNIRDTNESMMRAMAMAPRQHRRPDITDEDVRLPFFVIRVDKNGEITLSNKDNSSFQNLKENYQTLLKLLS